jgi:hypothetical protein
LVGETTQAIPELCSLLHDIETFVRRYVVLSERQAIAALWIAHTHAIDAADITPYLQISGATRECGKTRLLEVLEALVARPELSASITAPALLRIMDDEHPTLLLDESDATFIRCDFQG